MSIGDFNKIVSEFEKEGGSSRPRRQIKNFLDSINWCDLKDLGFVGPRFTWLYQRADGAQIRERLDHALASLDWMGKFQDAKLYHITSLVSNHSPLALHFFSK